MAIKQLQVIIKLFNTLLGVLVGKPQKSYIKTSNNYVTQHLDTSGGW